MQDIWIFGITSLVLIWLLLRWRHRRFIMLSTKFPSVWAHMLTGFGYMVTSKGSIKLFTDGHKKYGPSYCCYILPYTVLSTTDPVIIGEIFKQCTKKSDALYSRVANAIGQGIITKSGPSWSHERKIINPAFNNKNLMSFIPIFNEEVNKILGQIEKDTAENIEKPIINYFREFTLRIATRTMIGRNLDKTHYKAEEILEATNQFHHFLAEVVINNIYILSPIRKFALLTYFKNAAKLEKSLRSVINETFMCYATKRSGDASYENSITTGVTYMAKGYEEKRISAEYATDDLMHLYLGAFETTSTSLYFILLMLGMHPEYQKRAYEEICTIFPDKDDGNFNVTYEDIQQLVYLEMVINETMRVLPVIPQVGRQIGDNDLTLSNGVVLPKGLHVLVNIYSLHRSTEIWGPNANKFDPDHFLPANAESRHPYSFIPFTKGLRFCIGWRYAQLSMTVALAKLIKRYRFIVDCKLEDFQFENQIVLKIIGDPPVILERRRNL